MNYMKQKMILSMVTLLLFLLLPVKITEPAEVLKEGVLRLHILANSDSEADQAVKLRVRDALLPLFEAAGSYDDARSFVLDHGAALMERCQRALISCGAPYGAQLLLGVDDFPDRTYNGVLFPAGAYDALRIVLGDGVGHNWWCVLFPPLCIVVPDDGVASNDTDPQSPAFTFESDLLAFFRRHFGKDR